MKHIIPHLWFDTQAKEAADFYTTVFPDTHVTNVTTLSGTPSGDSDIVSFSIAGVAFQAISAGPYFKLNPSISFMVNFDPSRDGEAATRINEVWAKLAEGGKVLMPINEYPFSKRYGWVEDRYGVSWQLILTSEDGEERPFIIPSLLFVGDKHGLAEEAVNLYLSVFKNSKRGTIQKYPAQSEPNKEGTVMFSDFTLFDTWFVAMDGGGSHDFAFNEAISLIVTCDTQEEIDYYWKALSAVPESEQCGWLKDKFGISWQIVPTMMEKVMQSGDKEKIQKLTQVFLPMKKFDIAALKQAISE